MYFLPAFFDIMVHQLVHIVEDIFQLEPTFLQNMMSFERMNGVIKGYIFNRSCPHRSMAKGFLTEECISSCMNYLNIKNPIGLPINKHLERIDGWDHHEGRREMHINFTGRLTNFDRANLVALQHMKLVDPWVEEHKSSIAKMYSDRGKLRTEGAIIKEHNSHFTCWFKDTLLANPPPMQSSEEEQLIFSLSHGAEHCLMIYQAYDINSYTF
jgi:hypothetical protein